MSQRSDEAVVCAGGRWGQWKVFRGQAGCFFLGLPRLVTESQGGGFFLCLPFPSPTPRPFPFSPPPPLPLSPPILAGGRAGRAERLGAGRGGGRGEDPVPARGQCPAPAGGVRSPLRAASRRGVSRPRAAGAPGARIVPAALPYRVGTAVSSFEFFSPPQRCISACAQRQMLWGARPQFRTSSGDGGRGEVVGVGLLPSARRGGAAGATAGTWHRRCDPSCGHQGVGGAAEAPRAQPAAGGPRRRAGTPPPAPRGPRVGREKAKAGGRGRRRRRAGPRAAPELASGRAASGKVVRPLGASPSPAASSGFRPRRRGRDPPARAPGAVGPALPSASRSARLSPDPARVRALAAGPGPGPPAVPAAPLSQRAAPREAGRRCGALRARSPAPPPSRAPAVGEGFSGSCQRGAESPRPFLDPTDRTDHGPASIFTEIRPRRVRASAQPGDG